MPRTIKYKTSREKRHKKEQPKRSNQQQCNPRQQVSLSDLFTQLYTMIINSRLAMGASAVTMLLLAYMAFQYRAALFGIEPESPFQPLALDQQSEDWYSDNNTYIIPPNIVLRSPYHLSSSLDSIFNVLGRAFIDLKIPKNLPENFKIQGHMLNVFSVACFGGSNGQFDEALNVILICAYLAKNLDGARLGEVACLARLQSDKIAYALTIIADKVPSTWQSLCRLDACDQGQLGWRSLASVVGWVKSLEGNGTEFAEALSNGDIQRLDVGAGDDSDVSDAVVEAYEEATQCKLAVS